MSRVNERMKDLDVITKVSELFTTSSIYETEYDNSWATLYTIHIRNYEAIHIMDMIYHFMGTRRKVKILEIIHTEPEQVCEFNELMWTVGLLEGEGSFMKGAPSAPNRPIISIQMTDKDVLEKLSKMWDTRIQKGRPPQEKHHKQAYQIQYRGRKAVSYMQMIKQYMSIRRQQQITDALNSYSYKKGKLCENDVRVIRQMLSDGQSTKNIGLKFCVDSGTIRMIKRGETWKHIQ